MWYGGYEHVVVTVSGSTIHVRGDMEKPTAFQGVTNFKYLTRRVEPYQGRYRNKNSDGTYTYAGRLRSGHVLLRNSISGRVHRVGLDTLHKSYVHLRD